MINYNIASPPTQTRVTGGHTGGWNVDSKKADILEYRDGDGWRNIGAMRDARVNHATSLIDFKDVEDYCNY